MNNHSFGFLINSLNNFIMFYKKIPIIILLKILFLIFVIDNLFKY